MAHFQVDFLEDYSAASIIAELRRLASALGKDTLSRSEIDSSGRVSSAVVIKRFGSLRQALQAAGLKPMRFMKASDDELLEVLEEAWVQSEERFGRRPERADLKVFGCPVSPDTIVRRFGSWKKALLAVVHRASSEDTTHELPLSASPAQVRQTGKAMHREPVSVRKRFLVFKRDRYTCCLCGQSGVSLEVDHIVPFARGGMDDLANLQTLCFKCNRGKRDSLQ